MKRHKLTIPRDLLLRLCERKVDINTLVDRLDAEHVFDAEREQHAVREWKKSVIRREVKGVKNAQGIPLIFSIVDINDDGETVRKYKQEMLFNVEEYRQVIEQYRKRRIYNSKIEKYLMKRLAERFPEASLFPVAGPAPKHSPAVARA